MKFVLILLPLLLLGVPAFKVFSSGARKIGKSPALWGWIGVATSSATYIILLPIVIDVARSSRDGGSVLFSYVAIDVAIAAAAAVVVYKMVLLKPPGARGD